MADMIRRRPEPVPFNKFIYNSRDGTILGRTSSSWGKILGFYAIFYTVLAIFVSIYLGIWMNSLDDHVPKYTLSDSLIGTNPGLGYRPIPTGEQIDSTLIWFKGNDDETTKQWTLALDDFLKEYRRRRTSRFVECSYDSPPAHGQMCNVDVSQWAPCTKENNYSYQRSAPCIFLKLNKIYNWIPEYYNKSADLPENMPSELQAHIKEVEENSPAALNTIWVSCAGENPADIENIGPITFIPQQGFPGFYYPFDNDEGYLSPLVAVQLLKPRRGILINIECKAWARNIRHDRSDRLGSVHFELMID